MPTLTRIVVYLFALAVVGYVGMVALVTFEKPTPREIVVPVDLPKPAK